MTVNEFFYPSADGITQIRALEWVPDGAPRGILQISHGMVEFIDRYDRFARAMASAGFYVTGNDHLGHGRSVVDQDALGYFAVNDPCGCVQGDLLSLRRRAQEKHPEVPYFILGHSMGSFLVRRFIELYPDGVRGAVIMGTGWQDPATLAAAKTLTGLTGLVKGDRHRSKFLTGLALGSNNKPFEPARTPVDWLSRNTDNVDRYMKEPLNNFTFTVNGYRVLFTTIAECEKKENIARLPKDLPILIVSGAEDPVGAMGKGVKKTRDSYLAAGMTDVTMKLYENDRHEILNEDDCAVVDADILGWMEARLPAGRAKA